MKEELSKKLLPVLMKEYGFDIYQVTAFLSGLQDDKAEILIKAHEEKILAQHFSSFNPDEDQSGYKGGHKGKGWKFILEASKKNSDLSQKIKFEVAKLNESRKTTEGGMPDSEVSDSNPNNPTRSNLADIVEYAKGQQHHLAKRYLDQQVKDNEEALRKQLHEDGGLGAPRLTAQNPQTQSAQKSTPACLFFAVQDKVVNAVKTLFHTPTL
ncbi:hypothetical protein [Piscirickettsia litoralis]|uniref:Uncharacterized protein n=1 Tax=Piscirickettsia litoralis TaxID=1891921 RepID=A0ABX2ZWR8_9GAMM|nr:hypothetical protein [Piscirickettsia litoralis]ODN41059.1 hypothetical protein BGC07_18095 [Piscirickettsia litoralis]